jgi:multiple sugar transport system permease protein
MRKRNRTGWRKVINGVNISGLFVVLFIVLPLYWLIITSFRNPADLGSVQYWPNPFSGANYSQAFNEYGFGSYFIHSVVVTLSATALVLIFGTMAGYALGRLPMRGKFTLMVTLLMISLFPEIATATRA